MCVCLSLSISLSLSSCRKPKSQEGNKSFVPEPRESSVFWVFRDSYAYEHFMHVNIFPYHGYITISHLLKVCKQTEKGSTWSDGRQRLIARGTQGNLVVGTPWWWWSRSDFFWIWNSKYLSNKHICVLFQSFDINILNLSQNLNIEFKILFLLGWVKSFAVCILCDRSSSNRGR